MYKSNTKTTTIKIFTPDEENYTKALCILLGGYNRYGRNIDIEEYEKAISNFHKSILDIKYLLDTTNQK